MLHTMFIDARMERLIVANPSELPRDALPKKRDKDPLWRSSAHSSREEVELLISDERIPWDRRMTLDDLIAPNAPVLLHSSGVPLAMELQQDDRKRISEMKPDDVKHCRMPQMGLDRAKADCEKLGLRRRRNHDARRTMISLARAGGASKDLLEWVTHGPPGDRDRRLYDAPVGDPPSAGRVHQDRAARRQGARDANGGLSKRPSARRGPGRLLPGGRTGWAQVWAQVLGNCRNCGGKLVGRTGFGPVTSTV